METVLKEVTGTQIPAEPLPPVEPQGGFPWGGVGIGVLVVAGIAIATKVLSD
jgi:hypothetical protein|tara:strand:- start:308 stop:463 length:156 start_codon:yes stop_codon:yes gene_type:complete